MPETPFARCREMVNSELREFFSSREDRASNLPLIGREAFSNLKEYNLRGGKRIRPMLAIFSYKAFGGRNEREMVKAALAVELMEAYLLIHDDIIDNDELRRNGPTMHKIYERMKNDQLYGRAMAIVVGDICASLGSEAILNTNFSAEKRLMAVDKFNRVIVNTCIGQMLDIESQKRKVTEKDITDIHTLKTAIYTIEGPLHIGAILAGAGKEDLGELSDFAIPLGKAFQTQDDILGMFGTREKIGKPVGSDVREGKKTLLMVKALELGSPTQRKFIQRCLGNKRLTFKQLEKLREIVTKTGSLDYSKRLIERYSDEARVALGKLKISNEGRQFFMYICNYIIQRDK